MNSFSEENYLKAIWKLSQQDNSIVSTNAIAAEIKTKAASVTDMLKKLSAKKLIRYRRYQGVTLTAAGKRVASAIVRKHRLWEVFLVEKMGFGWDEVHDIAEQLEHIRSESLTERLDRFLGFPRFDPHGDPIPDSKGELRFSPGSPLSTFRKGEKTVVCGVNDHSVAFLRFLDSNHIRLGDVIEITSTVAYDSSMQVKSAKAKNIHLSHTAADNILVKKVRPATQSSKQK